MPRLFNTLARVALWITVPTAVAALVIFAFFFVRERNFVRSSTRTTGIVVELKPKQSDDTTYFYPLIRFTDGQGKTHDRYGTGSSPAEYIIGDKVSILYSSSQPEESKADAFLALWTYSLLFGVVGAGNLTFSILCIVVIKLTREGAKN